MLVVDASVAIKWMVPEDGADAALALLDEALLAPDWMLAEFGNIVWKKVRRREMDDRQAREAIAILPTIVSMVPTIPYVPDALEIALALDHPFYDCLYLAAAQAHAYRFATADRRLVDKCKAAGIDIAITRIG
jgi:predicted nucleic acid-binding protein